MSNGTSVMEIVKAIIADELGIEEFRIIPSARLIVDLGADSIDLVEIVVALEEHFRINIADAEVINLATAGQVMACVQQYLAKQGRS